MSTAAGLGPDTSREKSPSQHLRGCHCRVKDGRHGTRSEPPPNSGLEDSTAHTSKIHFQVRNRCTLRTHLRAWLAIGYEINRIPSSLCSRTSGKGSSPAGQAVYGDVCAIPPVTFCGARERCNCLRAAYAV